MNRGIFEDVGRTGPDQAREVAAEVETFQEARSEHDLRVHIAELLGDADQNFSRPGPELAAEVKKSIRRLQMRELTVSVGNGVQAIHRGLDVPTAPLSAPAFYASDVWPSTSTVSRPLSRCISEESGSIGTTQDNSRMGSPVQDVAPQSAPSTSRATEELLVSGTELFEVDRDESTGNATSSVSEYSPLSRIPVTPRSAPTSSWLGRIDSDAARLITLDQRYQSGSSLQPRRKRRSTNLPPGAQRGQFGKHVCPFIGCSRRFTLSGNLAVHIRTVHEKEKPYACPYPGCGRRFTQKGNANTHYRTVHLREVRFRCPVVDCGRRFAQKANLLFHAQRQHGLAELDLLMMGMHPFARDTGQSPRDAPQGGLYTPKSEPDGLSSDTIFPNPAGG
ncbi:hypothetical protein CCYA_CCYA10G2917 [Cyanidiococcus yangmingshanensis]|nr:hypothetical protein CCYA_CCYA10G2917 [Cyanidiococcus yangmingshanensis]